MNRNLRIILAVCTLGLSEVWIRFSRKTAIGVTAAVLVFGGIGSALTPADTGTIAMPTPGSSVSAEASPSPSVEASPSPSVEPEKQLTDGTLKKFERYLRVNFEGTDWLPYVTSLNYYLDGPYTRVIDVSLNSLITSDSATGDSLAQIVCTATFGYWYDEGGLEAAPFDVLFVGNSNGNVFRREDFANGEKCLD
jgi:hypothetical protein